jgi:hypothetical protein
VIGGQPVRAIVALQRGPPLGLQFRQTALRRGRETRIRGRAEVLL